VNVNDSLESGHLAPFYLTEKEDTSAQLPSVPFEEEIDFSQQTTSVHTPYTEPGLPGEKLSERPHILSLVFIIFLGCFIIFSQVINKKWKMISSMVNGLIHEKGRHSIFFVTTENELYNKLLLCIQFAVLMAIFIYTSSSHWEGFPVESLLSTGVTIGILFLSIIIYLLYKCFAYNIAGRIFFDRNSLEQWLDSYISLIGISGMILLLPVLVLFYVEPAFEICYFFILFYLLMLKIIIIYKSYILFFNNKNLLVHLFLYLCAQEIIPIFLLYKGMIYLFNVVQKNALWL
jgi:hypothetical protein